MIMTLDKNKVLLGFSGGVDSTAAALILKEKGYEVHGIFFNVFGPHNTESQKRAVEVAKQLSISLILKDVSQEFGNKIKKYFFNEYTLGKTPNPCVQCNKHIKFRFMLEQAKEIGAFYIATGHYAKLHYSDALEKYMIKKPAALYKDQTYMLYNLNQEILKHVLFPLSHIESKDHVRNIVSKANLPNAKTKDSQEICFIPDNNYVNFICNNYHYEPKEGNFVDKSGNILGKHRGIIHYTIGQRKGLGIALGKPVYVTDIDAVRNTVTLGNDHELLENIVRSKDNNFIHLEINKPVEAEAKIRYAAYPSKATIFIDEPGIIKTVFKQPQRAVTPGQSIVFYSGETLLGGGIII